METEIENHIDQKHKLGGKMSTIEHNAAHQATAVACVTKTLMMNTDHAENDLMMERVPTRTTA